mgnify:CR=1 FL=1
MKIYIVDIGDRNYSDIVLVTCDSDRADKVANENGTVAQEHTLEDLGVGIENLLSKEHT